MPPLTDRQVNELYEIYQCPQPGVQVLLSQGTGLAYLGSTGDYVSLQSRLGAAIALINANPSWVARVTELLTEYDNWAMDPSPITKDGYFFTQPRSLKKIRELLYPFTGVWMPSGIDSLVPLG